MGGEGGGEGDGRGGEGGGEMERERRVTKVPMWRNKTTETIALSMCGL